jgi:hypothetical protein
MTQAQMTAYLADKNRNQQGAGKVHARRVHGQPVDENLLQHVSPLGWEHINLTGDYVWRQDRRVERGKFRPLRAFTSPIAVGTSIAEGPPHRSRRA